MTSIFEPYDLSGLKLPNRIVMAPMTRARAKTEEPDDLTALYYSQRASAGLIVTEGAPISVEGRGYLYSPGLHTEGQARGWRRVTSDVHAAGGRIFAQLWHVGRISHTSIQKDGAAPVSSTATPAKNAVAYAYDEDGKPASLLPSQPRALETDEIARLTEDFVKAARFAIDVGFDGVELHAANGYLFDQFINGAVNDRTDQYGGSIENRMRFLLETLDAVSNEVGSNRVGVRVSPFGRLYDMFAFDDEFETWTALASEFDRRSLAYVHLSDQLSMGAVAMPDGFAAAFTSRYRGTLIGAGGYTLVTGEKALAAGEVNLIAMGKPYIANPDLVERLLNGWPLATPDRDTFYGDWGVKGYTDYPTYQHDAFIGKQQVSA